MQLSPSLRFQDFLYDSLFLRFFLPQNICFWLPETGII